jgi:hypothetical protein
MKRNYDNMDPGRGRTPGRTRGRGYQGGRGGAICRVVELVLVSLCACFNVCFIFLIAQVVVEDTMTIEEEVVITMVVAEVAEATTMVSVVLCEFERNYV